MKVSAKPLKSDAFELDVQPEDTVEVLKAKIEAAKPDLPADLQKIVHAGKVLGNSSTLQECGVKDGDLVVVMLSKAKGVEPPASSSASTAAPAAPAASAAQVDPGTAAAVALVPGEPMAATVQMLCEMGFPRPEVERCLRAAFNNPDRAVEYLMNGIPHHLLQAAVPAPAAPPPGVPAAGAGPGGSPYGMMPPYRPMRSAPATGPLAQLQNHSRFNQLRMVVQQSPQALNQVLALMAQSDPSLIPLIAEHQEEFVRLLQEPVGPMGPGGAGGLPNDPVAAMIAAAQAAAQGQSSQPPMAAAGPGAAVAPASAAGPAVPAAPAAAPQLTAANQEALDRLAALGVSRERALEAYLACDRNEEMAANYLFEAMED